jgi:hypothetical protein
LRPALTSREYFISENKNVIGRLFGSAIVRRQQFAAARPGGGKGTTHGENQKSATRMRWRDFRYFILETHLQSVAAEVVTILSIIKN